MILSEVQIKTILMSPQPEERDLLNVVQTYIHDRKKLDTGPIRATNSPLQAQLLLIAFNCATEYYTEKYFKR